MDSPLFFNDIPIGRVWVSPRRTVTEADVVNFATMTGDFNPLHVDYDYAAKSHYRRPVAHGLLGLAWVAGLGSYFPNVSTLAFTAIRDWQFTRPIFFGDTVFVETVCLEKSPAGRRSGKVVWHRKLINQSDQIVQEGVFETLVATESPVPDSHFGRDLGDQSRRRSSFGSGAEKGPDSNLGSLESRPAY